MSNKCISQTRKELERYATYRQINGKDMPHMDRSMEKICHIWTDQWKRYATYRQINGKDMPHMDRSMEKPLLI